MINKSFEVIVAAIAAKTPTPGGGAAAAMSASLGAALFLMVVRFSRGKKANLEQEDELGAAETQLERLLNHLLPMAERDCAAFDLVSNAYGLPKTTDSEKAIRDKAIEAGLLAAMAVPEEVACVVRDVFFAIAPVASCVKRNICSDLGSGSELLFAAAESVFFNIRINAAFLKDAEKADAALDRNRGIMAEIRKSHANIFDTVQKQLMG